MQLPGAGELQLHPNQRPLPQLHLQLHLILANATEMATNTARPGQQDATERGIPCGGLGMLTINL